VRKNEFWASHDTSSLDSYRGLIPYLIDFDGETFRKQLSLSSELFL
jgi:hypothetical protein